MKENHYFILLKYFWYEFNRLS